MSFEVFSIKYNDFCIIPLAYNTYIYNNDKYKDSIAYYENVICLPDEIIGRIEQFLKKDHIKNKNTTYILDFDNISSCNRIFTDCNEEDFIKKIVFANISNNTSISGKIKNCIENLFEVEKKGLMFLYYKNYANKGFDTLDYDSIYNNQIYNIFKTNNVLIDYSKDYLFLNSSGIYANYYFSIRNIFFNPDAYHYIAYRLAFYISKLTYFNEIDAFVSTSKTGGIIATLVGTMLDKKVIHCIGIGPKNVADIETINEKIRIGKKYFLISDFICLGTEVKIINTIISCLKASLIGGITIASYVDFVNNSDYKDSPLNKINTIIRIKNTDLDYKILVVKEKSET